MAYNPMGIATRALQDWFDSDLGNGVSKENIRALHPELSEEAVEALHDNLRGELRRRELGNAEYQASSKSNIGQRIVGELVGGASPVDLVPLGRGSTFGRRLAEGAGANLGVDAVMQASDIELGAQGAYSPEQGFIAGATGAGLQGVIEGTLKGASALGRTVTNRIKPVGCLLDTDGATPGAHVGESGRIPVPTGRKNSKAFKTQVTETSAKVRDLVGNLTSEWKNAPNYEVLDDFSKTDIVDKDAIGVYREDGTVVLNTQAIALEARKRKVFVEDIVSAVAFHEGLGHYGLAQKFGEDLDYILGKWYEQADPKFRKTVDDWLEANPEAYKGDPYRTERATEEILAEWSEKGELPVKFVDIVANKMKEFSAMK
jgi:hypothetical protein